MIKIMNRKEIQMLKKKTHTRKLLNKNYTSVLKVLRFRILKTAEYLKRHNGC